MNDIENEFFPDCGAPGSECLSDECIASTFQFQRDIDNVDSTSIELESVSVAEMGPSVDPGSDLDLEVQIGSPRPIK